MKTTLRTLSHNVPHSKAAWLSVASGLRGPQLMLVAAVLVALSPLTATAAGLTSRTDKLSTSQASQTASHIISFTTATAATIASVGFQFCTTATGACTEPTGMTTTGATLSAQSGGTSFTMHAGTDGAPYVSGAGVALGAGAALSYTLSGLVNPSTTNQTFYVRVVTYTGSDGATGAVDSGQIADSTATPIQLTGVTPPILVFCVGITITTDCSTVTGSSIDFGDFSPVSTRTGTSVMQAQTNASNGYTITVNGTTLASGTNTIPAMTGAAVSPGTSQFGLNLRANTTPAVGSDPSGGGSGVAAANYASVNAYRFGTGDAVATAPAPTNANTFTSSYVVNIGGAQAAGVYTATMTYICTASF